jgi:hypothetical protein
VAVTIALLADQLAWPTTMERFLPEDWAEDADRRACTSPQVTDRLDACTEVRAAGIQIDGVLADAAYGNVHAFRTAIDRMGLRCAVGVASRLTVQVTGVRRRCKIGRVIKQLPRRAWRWVPWGHWPLRSLHCACAPRAAPSAGRRDNVANPISYVGKRRQRLRPQASF